MAESLRVRCPSCLRDHQFAAPVYPCVCGASLSPPLLHGAAPERFLRRTWAEDWVQVRCEQCGRLDHWPQPELGCPCGTLLRIPVRSAEDAVDTDSSGAPQSAPQPSHIPLPRTANSPRPAFRPIAIRTARDAVTMAELYLKWLGFREVVQQDIHLPEARPEPPVDTPLAPAIDLRGPGLTAQVNPSTQPAAPRDVECLWLTGLTAAAETTVYFSLAGYAGDARTRADDLGVALFSMDLTGSPQPVNTQAAELVSTGV
ncbi:hypothetical protein [Streptomyces sp. NBC_00690]|uniref:hypothetical protein n=1 Tax=Streptomyces sp. NBC_00690 TaxID=2975808 RepID=UPI002E292CF7|nr:hypothetical protein [Streptomyces sp. NBC_00690]